MTVLLQDKLQRMKESRFFEEYVKRLTGFRCFSIVEALEFPPSLSDAIARANKSDTLRQGKIACTEDRADIFSWVEKMFIDSAVGVERFYLSTPFRFFPWLDCSVANDNWIQNLSDVRDLNFSAISHDKKVFISIANEEYWLDAYWCDLK